MFNLTSLLFTLLFSFSVLAQDSVAIKKGEAAKFDGVLFTTEKAQDIRKELIEKDQFKLFNETLLSNEVIYKRIIKNDNEQKELILNQNDKLVKQAQTAGSLTTLEKALWVGLGVVATSLAVMGAGSLAK